MSPKPTAILKDVKIKSLQSGPIRDVVLPDGFIERVRKFKLVLGEVEPTSLEETMANFQRDYAPEKELKIWERMASAYDVFVAKSSFNLETKKEILSVLLGYSMGIEKFEKLNCLDKDQIEDLVHIYKTL